MSGRAFVFGDCVDTDAMAPGYLMKASIEEIAKHCLATLDPDFPKTVRPGDVVVAGANFGLGSSREQAAAALKILGVSAVLARSFARIFYRNAINLGLPLLVFDQAGEIRAGDHLEISPAEGLIANLTTSKSYHTQPLPTHLIAMLNDGGLIPHLKKRFAEDHP